MRYPTLKVSLIFTVFICLFSPASQSVSAQATRGRVTQRPPSSSLNQNRTQDNNDLAGKWKIHTTTLFGKPGDDESTYMRKEDDPNWSFRRIDDNHYTYSFAPDYDLDPIFTRTGPTTYVGHHSEATKAKWRDRSIDTWTITLEIMNGQLKGTGGFVDEEGYVSKEYWTGYREGSAASEVSARDSRPSVGCGPVSKDDSGNLPEDRSLRVRFDRIKPFSIEGIAAVRAAQGNKWGFISRNGATVVSPIWNTVSSFYGDMAAVGRFAPDEQHIKWGVVNTNGVLLVDGASYDVVKLLGEGFAALGHTKFKLVDHNGTIYSSGEVWDDIQCFENGRARAMRNGYSGYIDKFGTWYPDRQ